MDMPSFARRVAQYLPSSRRRLRSPPPSRIRQFPRASPRMSLRFACSNMRKLVDLRSPCPCLRCQCGKKILRLTGKRTEGTVPLHTGYMMKLLITWSTSRLRTKLNSRISLAVR